MAFSPSHIALGSYVDVTFSLWLSIILIITYQCAIRSPCILLIIVYGISATILILDKHSSTGEMIKTICLLPLGLGSVLAFLIAKRSFQTRYLPIFTKYINFAVYGNIGMMVGTPAGGTLRGLCSKLTCVALFIWVVLQGRRAGWKTVVLSDNMFIFTAVSKSWIFAHAIYRFILLTLPCFGSGRRHRLLEVYSLALTFLLSSTSNLPFEHCFGMADTLTVPAIAGWSAIATIFNIVPRDRMKNDSLFGDQVDAYLAATSLAVAAFACFKIMHSLS